MKIGGYPADKPIYNQYIMSGSANLSNGVLSYTIDTFGGQSGAPVLDNNTNRVLVSILQVAKLIKKIMELL